MLNHHTHPTNPILDTKTNTFDTSTASPSRHHNFAVRVSHRCIVTVAEFGRSCRVWALPPSLSEPARDGHEIHSIGSSLAAPVKLGVPTELGCSGQKEKESTLLGSDDLYLRAYRFPLSLGVLVRRRTTRHWTADARGSVDPAFMNVPIGQRVMPALGCQLGPRRQMEQQVRCICTLRLSRQAWPTGSSRQHCRGGAEGEKDICGPFLPYHCVCLLLIGNYVGFLPPMQEIVIPQVATPVEGRRARRNAHAHTRTQSLKKQTQKNHLKHSHTRTHLQNMHTHAQT